MNASRTAQTRDYSAAIAAHLLARAGAPAADATDLAAWITGHADDERDRAFCLVARDGRVMATGALHGDAWLKARYILDCPAAPEAQGKEAGLGAGIITRATGERTVVITLGDVRSTRLDLL